MKAKLIINNQELEVEISEEEYKKLQPRGGVGYMRVKEADSYFIVNSKGNVDVSTDNYVSFDNDCYKSANYYSSRAVAENNARADKLMRQLRRFAVEHREKKIDWYVNTPDGCGGYYCITFDIEKEAPYGDCLGCCQNYDAIDFGQIYFDSKQTAQLAIDTFHDELIWYFTEYKDSL